MSRAASVSDQPWLDRPDAIERLEARVDELTTTDYDRLRQWEREGYAVLEQAIASERIDAFLSDCDRLVWGSEREKSQLAWPVDDLLERSPSARGIAFDPFVTQCVDLILGRHSEVRKSIAVWKSGRHALHQDILLFPALPFNMTAGIHVVCEDAHPDAGPLEFYPGTHKLPLWQRWPSYPDMSLRTCDAETAVAYEAWIDAQASDYTRRTFLGRKGDVMLWHPSLAHAGTELKDERRTRKSFVMHTFPDGCERGLARR
jgi:hypothetical protein